MQPLLIEVWAIRRNRHRANVSHDLDTRRTEQFKKLFFSVV